MKTLPFLIFLFSIQVALAQSNDWLVRYTEDKFSSDALLDLRYLNETLAGESGFVRKSGDGRGFVLGNGQPVRFWAVNGGDVTKDWTDVRVANYARFLAKMGVNMVRYHGNICPRPTNPNLNEPDMAEINNIWRVVEAMKREGIYTVISPFWAGFVNEMPAAWGLGEYQGAVQPWALMYFNDRFKNAYKKWLEVLYTRPNPRTGLALKDDPAVALIQIKNEDSVLFWTIQGVKNDLKEVIEKLFFRWATAKYGTAQAALAAWNNVGTPTDNIAAQRFGIYIIYEATIPQTGGQAKRVNDMVQFLTEHQRNFYTDIVAHHKALGCRQLTNASNWKTASQVYLNDPERWSNEVADVMAVNRYYDPQHIGENNGWRIDPGHQFVGKSVLFQPEQLPINIKQPHNKPFMVTESGWNLPNKHQAEGPFLVAAYMSLTGVDGFFWFQASSSVGIDPSPYFDFTNLQGGQKAMYRWTYSTPGQILMMPANALLYRKGYVTESKVVATEERTLAAMWERKIPLITEENSFDPNRDSWENAGNATQTELAPITYLAGGVEVKYNSLTDAKAIAPNLNQLLNFKDKVVTSNTGQLKWDYKNGVCTMNTPAAQGITGFLKKAAPSTQLADVKISSDNEYATINVVSMDDKPLKTSEKILVQVGTSYRPSLWDEIPSKVKIGNQDVDGFTVRNTGRMPWLAQNTQATIVLNNPAIRSAFLLDLNGQKSEEILVEQTNNQAIVRLPETALYVVLGTAAPTITSVENIEKVKIELYPNPTADEITFQLPATVNPKNQLTISTIEGKTIQNAQNLSSGQHRISTQNWAAGTYVFVFEFGKSKITKKVVIKK